MTQRLRFRFKLAHLLALVAVLGLIFGWLARFFDIQGPDLGDPTFVTHDFYIQIGPWLLEFGPFGFSSGSSFVYWKSAAILIGFLCGLVLAFAWLIRVIGRRLHNRAEIHRY